MGREDLSYKPRPFAPESTHNVWPHLFFRSSSYKFGAIITKFGTEHLWTTLEKVTFSYFWYYTYICYSWLSNFAQMLSAGPKLQKKKKKMPWPLNTLCQYNHFWWTLIDMRSEWPQQMWCYLANGWHCSNITYDKECLSVWCEHGCPSHNLWTIQQSDLVGLLLSTQSSAVLSVKSFIHWWVFLDNAASSHITVVEASISSGGQAINKCSERPHLNRHYTRIIK